MTFPVSQASPATSSAPRRAPAASHPHTLTTCPSSPPRCVSSLASRLAARSPSPGPRIVAARSLPPFARLAARTAASTPSHQSHRSTFQPPLATARLRSAQITLPFFHTSPSLPRRSALDSTSSPHQHCIALPNSPSGTLGMSCPLEPCSLCRFAGYCLNTRGMGTRLDRPQKTEERGR